MSNVTIEALMLFAVSGVLWSLVLEYFPGLHSWFNALADNYQKVVILLSGLVVVLGAFGLNCVGFLVSVEGLVCTTGAAFDLLSAYLVFVGTSQVTYLVTPKAS
jgi:hypothetical protein